MRASNFRQRGFSWRLVGRDDQLSRGPAPAQKSPAVRGRGSQGENKYAERHRAARLNDSSAWEPTMSRTK